MSVLENNSVKMVRKALLAAGLEDSVVELKKTAKTAEDAAKAVGTELGSIVKSLVFMIGDQPVMALGRRRPHVQAGRPAAGAGPRRSL